MMTSQQSVIKSVNEKRRMEVGECLVAESGLAGKGRKRKSGERHGCQPLAEKDAVFMNVNARNY